MKQKITHRSVLVVYKLTVAAARASPRFLKGDLTVIKLNALVARYTCSKGHRKPFPGGLTAAIQAADTLGTRTGQHPKQVFALS